MEWTVLVVAHPEDVAGMLSRLRENIS